MVRAKLVQPDVANFRRPSLEVSLLFLHGRSTFTRDFELLRVNADVVHQSRRQAEGGRQSAFTSSSAAPASIA